MQAVRILKVDVKYAGTKEANSSRVSLSLVCVWACDCVCATPSFFKIVDVLVPSCSAAACCSSPSHFEHTSDLNAMVRHCCPLISQCLY